MAGEKKFGKSLFGFRKADVNAYIERIIKEFDLRLKEKDEEISNLKNKNTQFKLKNDEITKKAEDLSQEKEKIAAVLIDAQENASKIIEEAKQKAVEEKYNLDNMLEEEREKIVDIKGDIRDIKDYIVNVLKKYEEELDSKITQIDDTYNSYNNE